MAIGAKTIDDSSVILSRAGRIGRTVAIVTLDAAFIFVAYFWAVYSSGLADDSLSQSLLTHMPYFAIFALWWSLSSLDQHLFGPKSNDELIAYLFTVTKAVGEALVLCTVIMALFSPHGVERDFLLAFGVGTLFVIVAFRLLLRLSLWTFRLRGLYGRRILIIGSNVRTSHLVDVIKSRRYYGLNVIGCLEEDIERAELLVNLGVPVKGAPADLDRVLADEEVDEVYISLPIRSFYSTIKDIAHYCEGEGIPVRLIADLFPMRIATNRIMYVEDVPMLSLSTVPEERFRLAMKRAFDFLVSTVLLVLLPLLFLPLTILIKLESPGPVFFAQERVGLNRRRFKMLKFRSMVVNAEELRQELEAMNEADGPVFKIRKDPRITRVGRFIRKYSLDEFPQLFNVWMGQMSLVGPRPPLASEVEKYSWDQRRRLSVKPGMTGLWQVSGRSDVNFKEWVELDLQYIDTWSLKQDFLILLKTFRAVVQGRGAA